MARDDAEGSSKKASNLTGRQRAVLIGTLLGDGCLAKHGRHSRLHVKHKSEHRALAEFKRSIFIDYVTMPLNEFDQRLGNRRYPCVQFATRTDRVFSEWRERFYGTGRKAVPPDVADLLSPLAIAVWFMDDGAADHFGATFQTHSFTESEVHVLGSALRERFDLVVRPRGNRGATIIYVPASGMSRLQEIVGPHVLPELAYKLTPRHLRTP
jgi:recombination protein RecA